MLIDWFTVIAQIVNFLILILLLRRFLYRPVLNAIEARKNRIAAEIQAAADLRAEASRIKADYELKIEMFESERKTLIAEALDEARTERARRMDEVRTETEALRQRLMQSFDDQRGAIEKQIALRAHEEVLAITRRALADLASKDLEAHIAAEFVRQLGLPQTENLKRYLQHDGQAADKVVVTTAFELGPQDREKITTAIRENAGREDIRPQFNTRSDLLCGVELRVNHHKLDWSFTGYLDSVNQKLSEEEA